MQPSEFLVYSTSNRERIQESELPRADEERPSIVLISFSGLDGAGKSTLIAWLKSLLEGQKRQVAVFHMNEDVGIYAYARALRDRLHRRISEPRPLAVPAGGNAGEVVVRSDAQGSSAGSGQALLKGLRNRILWNKPLRRCIYLVDLAIFFFYRFYIEGIRRRVLIMDRYFYDTLVDVSTDQKSLWVRMLFSITPTPSMVVFLDITPEESFNRKGEYTVEYLRRRWVGYQRVFAWVRNPIVLPNRDLSATMCILERAVLERTVVE
jgi:hypothetical protein